MKASMSRMCLAHNRRLSSRASLLHLGRSLVFVLDSFPEGGRGPVDILTHTLFRLGSEGVKAVRNDW
jgi:hypothetical protein